MGRSNFSLRATLVFLALAVFSWGLHGKLAQYHTESTSANVVSSTAKLSIERPSPRAMAIPESQNIGHLDCLAWDSLAQVVQLQLESATVASSGEPGPRTPGQYQLHSPNLLLLPPPSNI